jgi:hypothetical protein
VTADITGTAGDEDWDLALRLRALAEAHDDRQQQALILLISLALTKSRLRPKDALFLPMPHDSCRHSRVDLPRFQCTARERECADHRALPHMSTRKNDRVSPNHCMTADYDSCCVNVT